MIVQTAKTAYNVCTLPKHVLIHRIKVPKTVPVCHVTRLLPRCEHAGAAPLLHRDGHHHPHGEGKPSCIMIQISNTYGHIIQVDLVFARLDTNKDGLLTEEEFIQGCLQDPEILQSLENFQFNIL